MPFSPISRSGKFAATTSAEWFLLGWLWLDRGLDLAMGRWQDARGVSSFCGLGGKGTYILGIMHTLHREQKCRPASCCVAGTDLGSWLVCGLLLDFTLS